MSLHGKLSASSHHKRSTNFPIHNVIIDPGDDEIITDSYEDSRIELRTTGHNLTSVLMNPRETFIENIFNEFASDQRQPLESSNSSTSTSTSLLSMSSTSSSSSHHSISSNHSVASISSITSTTFSSTLLLFTTKAEDEEFNQYMKSISEAYNEYQRSHDSYHIRGIHPQLAAVKGYKSSSAAAEELEHSVKEVLDIFAKPEFNLQNIEMFNQAIGTRYTAIAPRDSSSSSTGDDHSRSSDSTTLIRLSRQISNEQQEKLTRYLDIVELALLHNIWERSYSFFRVLDDVRILQSQVSQCYNYITSLRHKYQQLNEKIAMTVLRIPKLYIRQRNENLLCEKIESIQTILSERNTVLQMIEAEDYLTALDIIHDMKKLYHSELVGLACMKEIGNQIEKYDGFICEVMCNKFVSISIQWEQSTLDMEIDTKTTSNTMIHDMNETSLDQLIRALMAVNKLEQAMKIYQSRLSDSVRLIIRTCVLEYLSTFDPTLVVEALESTQQESDTPFALRVREMSTENFLSCLAMCYENALIAIKKADNLHKFIESKLPELFKVTAESKEGYSNQPTPVVHATTTSKSKSKSISSSSSLVVISSSLEDSALGHSSSLSISTATYKSVFTLSKSCVTEAINLAQRSIIQLLSFRKESNIRMTVDKMKFLWEVSVHFVSSIEAILGSTAFDMRQSLLTQTKFFIDQLHEGYKVKLANTLDNERWVQCDVSAERQVEIDRLVSGKSFLQQKISTSTNGNDHHPGAAGLSMSSLSTGSISTATTAAAATANDNRTNKKDARPARVEESNYNVVWSVLFLLEIIMIYLDISISFPLITSELISKIIELIRLFDHRTRQLVLGAQSIQSAARLKSISARHLAITAQSIDFLGYLLPHIRTALLAQLSAKHHLMLTEFDRISHELLDHHNSIVSKFVSIVSDFIDASAIKLRHVDWERFQGQCEYFDEVLRNVTALHRVLLQLLPPEQLQDIFSRIFSLLNRKIPFHFEEIMPSTKTGKSRILDDVTHLVLAFSRLKQIDCKNQTMILEEIFRKRYGNRDIPISPAATTTSNNNGSFQGSLNTDISSSTSSTLVAIVASAATTTSTSTATTTTTVGVGRVSSSNSENLPSTGTGPTITVTGVASTAST